MKAKRMHGRGRASRVSNGSVRDSVAREDGSEAKSDSNEPLLRGSTAALTMFVVGFCTLELNFGTVIKPWNFVMVCGATLSAAMMALILSRVSSAPQPKVFFVDHAFLLYLTYCALSSIWSVSPADTIVQVCFLFAAWLGTLFLRVLPADQIVRLVAIVGFALVALSFVSVLVAPGLAFQPSSAFFPELRGIFQHQQRLGLFAGMILGLLAIAVQNGAYSKVLHMSTLHRRLLVLALFVCFLWAFARLNMLFVVLALIATSAVMRTRALRGLSILFGTVFAVWVWLDRGTLLSKFGGEDGLTLTGRTNVWDRTQHAIEDGTAWGYGFASFNSPVFDSYWGDYRAPSAHNSILQAMFETGIIGVIVLIILMVSHLHSAFRVGVMLDRIPYSMFLVILATLSSLTGVTYGGKPSILLVATLLILTSELQESKNSVHKAGLRRA